MRVKPTKTSTVWPATHAERDLAQDEADDWQSEFLDALLTMRGGARVYRPGERP